MSNTTTAIYAQPANLVEMKNDQPMTTSLKVAEVFGKRHADVIRAIEDINSTEEFAERNFAFSYYKPIGATRHYPMYEMTKDGFSFLVMGFTGAKADVWKERYIEAFNMMEKRLVKQDEPLSATAQLRLQLEALEAIEAKQEATDSRVEAIEHKIETNGCQPGYLPVSEAHRKFGTAVSLETFRLVIKAYNVDTQSYVYTIPDSGGQTASGQSVHESEMIEALWNFLGNVYQVSPQRWSHELLGDKRFVVNAAMAGKFRKGCEYE